MAGGTRFGIAASRHGRRPLTVTTGDGSIANLEPKQCATVGSRAGRDPTPMHLYTTVGWVLLTIEDLMGVPFLRGRWRTASTLDRPSTTSVIPLITGKEPCPMKITLPILGRPRRSSGRGLKRGPFAVLLPVATVLIVAGCGPTSTGPAPASSPGPTATPAALALQQQMVQVVKNVGPAVVLIRTNKALGSGIVFDSNGDIVTNNHVVAGASSLQVALADGKQYPARLVGSLPADDLAVLKVNATGLQPATLADSSHVVVGDIAMAIGNPLGLQSSVTQGIVSALGRTVNEDNGVVLPNVIQTSAEINPGNSGGALVNLQGQVIGIPTLAAVDPQLGGGQAPGIGFAIPSNTVRTVVTQLLSKGG
jgi:putative serine protease PepD